MDADDQVFTTFTTRMRQLILQYRQTLQEKDALATQIAAQKALSAQLSAQIEQMRRDYESLKLARMLTITDGDVDAAKARVAKLLRDINRCITLLNEQT